VGVALLALAMIWAVGVVIPQLRSTNKLQAEAKAGNFIYFGHLRHLDSEAIGNFISNAELLPVLTTQHRRMSEIAWTKHRRVQLSMALAVVGVSLVAVAGLS
jgi:hypothetical protein